MIEVVQDANLQCGEGPMWDARSQRLFWTDALGRAVYALERGSGTVRLLTDAVTACSIVTHRDGGLVLGGPDGFFFWSEERGVSLIADRCGRIPAKKINDCIADPMGRVFGGQENYREDAPYEPGYLFRLDTDGTLHVAEEGLHLANGMGFSPDYETFYLTDTIQRKIFAYDYDIAAGSLENRRVFVKVPQDDGLADGLTVDAAGFIWVARWFGGGLSRYDPDGQLERKVLVPVAQPSSVMFGGRELDELYVTSAAVRWESAVAPIGHDYGAPRGGPVFRLHMGVRGRPECEAGVPVRGR